MRQQVEWVRTAQESGERWSKQPSLSWASETSGTEEDASERNGISTIRLLSSSRGQTIMGFGGAFTEAAAYTLSRISPEKRERVIRSCYDSREGLGYTMGRVAIHSCDFSLGNYTYIAEGDSELATFDIAHERQWVIPMIQDAQAIAGQPLTLLASPWSPPAWMKTNGQMNGGGKLKPEYAGVWASYFARFLHAFREEGLTIWGVTVQNEPEAVQTWDSCIYTPEEMRDFIKDHLGPTLQQDGLENTRILICDHNRDIMVKWAERILADPDAAAYVWGTAFHWYVSEDFSQVGEVHDRYPEKHLLFTEGCQEGGVHLGAWHTGERYGRNIIGDLNHWTEGYLDWNLVLDETGGPNHVGNLCDAPIIVDTETGEIHYNSSYFYIGHFSRYIRPGAVRMDVVTHASPTIHATAFRNEDDRSVVVLMNEGDEPEMCRLQEEGLPGTLTLELQAHSIVTLWI